MKSGLVLTNLNQQGNIYSCIFGVHIGPLTTKIYDARSDYDGELQNKF